MAKVKRKRKRKSTRTTNKNKTLKEIYGILTMAFSLLIGISIYKIPSGAAGIYFREIFLGLLGIGAYIFPFISFAIGLALVMNEGKIKVQKKFISILLGVWNLIALLHISLTSKHSGLSFLKRLAEAYTQGKSSKYGGLVVEMLVSPVVYIFGSLGAYIVFLCTLIIVVVLFTDLSLKDIIEWCKMKVSLAFEKKVKVDLPQSEVSAGSVAVQNDGVTSATYQENIEKIDRKIKILDFIKLDESARDENKEEKSLNDINKEIHKNSDKNKCMNYIYPPIDLLNDNNVKGSSHDKKELLNNAKILEDTLLSFGVEAKVVQVSRGPSVTRYELHPSPGIKVSKIVNLSDDLALNLAAPTVRIEAPIPGKAAVGIEIPNKEIIPVNLREVIESREFADHTSKIAFTLGKDITGKCIVGDLSKMPHLLIAGATGSGKSVCINTLITSIVYKSSPQDVKMLMIDPKVVELSVYNGIPHLLIPVVTDPKKASSALYWAVNEMTQRYNQFAENNVRNIDSYNELMERTSSENKMPRIVIVIDELADLMMVAANDVEDAICRLSQMARAAGMHLVIATQRPSVDVITGVIKANIPSRISFAVSSQIDSRTILDMSGAEKLLGRGDMLFLPIGENKPIRIQGSYISEKEVENVVKFLKNSSESDYNEEIIEKIESNVQDNKPRGNDEIDELFYEAVQICIEYGQGSASMLQRRLRIGFNRAARLIDEMEKMGIVGPQEGSKPRQVLISKEEYNNNF